MPGLGFDPEELPNKADEMELDEKMGLEGAAGGGYVETGGSELKLARFITEEEGFKVELVANVEGKGGIEEVLFVIELLVEGGDGEVVVVLVAETRSDSL